LLNFNYHIPFRHGPRTTAEETAKALDALMVECASAS
jgi:hypothetical protein